jgi:hypothetical protein
LAAHRPQGQPSCAGIPDQKRPIPVRVRVVWDRDGETWIAGIARRWTHLLDTDAVGSAELTGTWPQHLAAIEPALDIMYSDQREPSTLAG